MKEMNGLGAIEFMKQGGKVVLEKSSSVYWYEDGRIKVSSGKGIIECELFNLNSKYYEYINPKNLMGWEKLEQDEPPFYIEANAEVTKGLHSHYTCSRDNLYNKYYNNANYFSTQEKAEEISFKQTLFRKLQRFSDENGGNELNWSDINQHKYVISFNHERLELDVEWFCFDKFFGTVCFISEDVALGAIELFRDDLIKYFTAYR